jgi:anti-sigma B factor antagonist
VVVLDLPSFHLEVRPDRSRVLVCVSGELDVATVPRLAQTVHELRELGWSAIALDLGAVAFVDSTGLGALLSLYDAARSGGWQLTIATSCPALERLITVSKLEQALPRG